MSRVVSLKEAQCDADQGDDDQVDIEDFLGGGAEAEMQVHPAAQVFPMLDGEALEELAEDIAANGLRVPIVLDKNGVLIDGRNRLAACKMAGVRPRFETLEGNAEAFIVSANINRRHLTPSQRIMAWAMLYPEPEQGGRGKSSDKLSAIADSLGASTGQAKNRLSQARFVIRQGGEELAKAVVSGGTRLSAAYEMARARERKKQEEADADALQRANFEKLQARAKDLADLVLEERLSLDDALATLRERDRTNEIDRDSSRKAVPEIFSIPATVSAVLRGLDLGERSILNRPDAVVAARDSLNTLLEKMASASNAKGDDDEA